MEEIHLPRGKHNVDRSLPLFNIVNSNLLGVGELLYKRAVRSHISHSAVCIRHALGKQ